MSRPLNLLLNGRFLTRPMTGVDRVATELSLELIRRLEEREAGRLGIAHPAAGIEGRNDRPGRLLELEAVPTMRLRGHLWEQIALARAAPEAWLLSLCNLGPVMRARQAVLIHDAQVFTQPKSYSGAFRMVYHALLPRMARRARLVLVVSEFSRRELEAAGVVPKGKAIVMHNGIDHMSRIEEESDTLARHGLERGGYFLAIGSLAAHKNFSMLVEASRARPKPALPLVVAGGGNAKVFGAHGIGDGDGVRFLGRVSDGELKALYAGAKALAFPSKTEGFGLPALEAMHCGCPVIASTGGAVPEVCGDAVLYADPGIATEWTAALERLAGDDAFCAELTRRGKARAAEFTWARAADTLIEAISAAQVE